MEEKFLHLILGIILATVWWCIVWPTIKRPSNFYIKRGGMYLFAYLIKISHFIRTGRSFRKDMEKYDQKVKDDTYEKGGWPRGTFTEWQLSDGTRNGIAQFYGELHGFTKIEDGFPPENVIVHAVFKNLCLQGMYTNGIWIVEHPEGNNVLVTHWKINPDWLPII